MHGASTEFGSLGWMPIVPSCRANFCIITPVVAEDMHFGFTISAPVATDNSESRSVLGHGWSLSAQIFAAVRALSRKIVAQKLALFVFSDRVRPR